MADVRGVRPAPAAAVAAAYVVLSLLARLVTGGEIYPFFTWDLFSRIPGEQLRPTLYLERVAGDRLDDAPVPLFESRYSRGSDIVGNQLTAALVPAVRTDADETRRLTTALRRQHLPPDATWALVWERYDPLERTSGVPPRSFEVTRFGPPGATVPDDHRLDRERGTVLGPEGSWRLVDRPGGVVTALGPWGDGDLRLSGWAGDPRTGTLPRRIVVFSGSTPIAYAGVGANGSLAVSTTGNEDLDRAGFAHVVPASDVPSTLDDLAVIALYDDGSARVLPPAAP